MIIGESRISAIVNKNAKYIIKELINFNQKYKKYLGKFIYAINTQKNAIYKRLNLVQKKFRDFLNYETEKRKYYIYMLKNIMDFSKINKFFSKAQRL